MKKILFLVTKSINGGAQKWTKEQIQICSNDFECFLGTDKAGWLVDNVHVTNTFLNDLIHHRFSIKYLINLIKFINQHKIDMIIASSANAGIYSRIVKLLNKNIKVIYVSHGWSSIYNGDKLKFVYMFIEQLLSNISDSILCISSNDYNDAKNIIKIKNNKLKLISNKIYPMSIKEKQKTLRHKILTVARLTKPKRIDLLIEAIKKLNVELHVIGDGPLRSKLETIKNDNVIFHGEINSFDNFSQYDIFALISDSEGLPLSALEAMSCGLPLVLSKVGGCSELISNNGILVNNNVSEIKNALQNCINNIEIFSRNSILLFDEKFNIEKNKHEYITYYNEIL